MTPLQLAKSLEWGKVMALLVGRGAKSPWQVHCARRATTRDILRIDANRGKKGVSVDYRAEPVCSSRQAAAMTGSYESSTPLHRGRLLLSFFVIPEEAVMAAPELVQGGRFAALDRGRHLPRRCGSPRDRAQTMAVGRMDS